MSSDWLEGNIRHRRQHPVQHEFNYHTGMLALDVDNSNLVYLLRFFSRNIDLMNRFEDRFSWVTKPTLKGLQCLKRNTPEATRKNISAQYDLGNDLFELFLYPSLMYSSAISQAPESTLDEASA